MTVKYIGIHHESRFTDQLVTEYDPNEITATRLSRFSDSLFLKIDFKAEKVFEPSIDVAGKVIWKEISEENTYAWG